MSVDSEQGALMMGFEYVLILQSVHSLSNLSFNRKTHLTGEVMPYNSPPHLFSQLVLIISLTFVLGHYADQF